MHGYLPLLALMLLVVVLYSVAYAMWFEELGANVGIYVGTMDFKITSHKFLCGECDRDESYVGVSDDGESAQVVIVDAAPNSSAWVGLVLSNEGTLPIKLTHVHVDDGGSSNIYVYGPFQAPGTSGVWGRVKLGDLPFPDDVGLPSPTCDPSKKLIVWIEIICPDSEGVETSYTITLGSVISIED